MRRAAVRSPSQRSSRSRTRPHLAAAGAGIALIVPLLAAAAYGAGESVPARATRAAGSRAAAAVAPRAFRTDSAGTLVLRNARWDSVRVEVRVGATADCDQQPAGATRSLQLGSTWAVAARAGQEVCWRREATPTEPTGAWTSWTARQLTARQVRTDSL
jgi:hypothetical protein